MIWDCFIGDVHLDAFNRKLDRYGTAESAQLDAIYDVLQTSYYRLGLENGALAVDWGAPNMRDAFTMAKEAVDRGWLGKVLIRKVAWQQESAHGPVNPSLWVIHAFDIAGNYHTSKLLPIHPSALSQTLSCGTFERYEHAFAATAVAEAAAFCSGADTSKLNLSYFLATAEPKQPRNLAIRVCMLRRDEKLTGITMTFETLFVDPVVGLTVQRAIQKCFAAATTMSSEDMAKLKALKECPLQLILAYWQLLKKSTMQEIVELSDGSPGTRQQLATERMLTTKSQMRMLLSGRMGDGYDQAQESMNELRMLQSGKMGNGYEQAQETMSSLRVLQSGRMGNGHEQAQESMSSLRLLPSGIVGTGHDQARESMSTLRVLQSGKMGNGHEQAQETMSSLRMLQSGRIGTGYDQAQESKNQLRVLQSGKMGDGYDQAQETMNELRTLASGIIGTGHDQWEESMNKMRILQSGKMGNGYDQRGESMSTMRILQSGKMGTGYDQAKETILGLRSQAVLNGQVPKEYEEFLDAALRRQQASSGSCDSKVQPERQPSHSASIAIATNAALRLQGIANGQTPAAHQDYSDLPPDTSRFASAIPLSTVEAFRPSLELREDRWLMLDVLLKHMRAFFSTGDSASLAVEVLATRELFPAIRRACK